MSNFPSVKYPREAVLDSKFMTSVSTIIQTKCQKLAHAFNSTEFANGVVSIN